MKRRRIDENTDMWGRIIDPAQNMDEIGDILIEDGKIAQIAPDRKSVV